MRKIGYLILFFLGTGLISCAEKQDSKTAFEFVDMLIGTAKDGHTIVSTSRPFAMVKPGPDTEMRRNYLHAGKITAFSQLHMSGTGGNAQSAVLGIMPTTGRLEVQAEEYASNFDPQNASAVPGYYSVELEDYGIGAEISSSDRVGLYRFSFPESDSSHILINVGHAFNPYRGGEINILDNKTISGTGKYNGYHGSDFDIAFYIQFSQPFNSTSGIWNGDEISQGGKAGIEVDGSQSLGAFLNFNTTKNDTILVKVGISYVDIEGAKRNIKEELDHWNFEKVKEDSKKIWEEVLSKIDVKGGPQGHKTVFYTSLYHSMLSPSILSDADGRYEGFDGNIHHAEDFTYYGEFSLWDTYRTVHPLLVLLEPERQCDMVESLVKVAEQGGWLPKWGWSEGYTGGMLGDHAVSLILDSYVKGLRNFNSEDAYKAMYKNATEKIEGVPWGRRGLYKYMDLQFAPEDAGYQKSKVADTHEYGPGGSKARNHYPEISGSASATLEFAYNDWCVSQMASMLGNEKDAALFRERAYYYKNVFDPQVGFMRPRNSDGSWAMNPFVPTISGQHSQFYCEGNAWTYSWAVQHDVQGLINLMGGEDDFNNLLDQAFEGLEEKESYYDPTNEPDIHYPYLYSYSGQPWKTQQTVRQILHRFFSSDRETGLPGDDDVGTMSSWYIFSAMGIYPVTPGIDEYVLGSPLFDEVIIHLDSVWYNNNEIYIQSLNNSSENIFVQNAELNGEKLDKCWISHSELVNNGHLVFNMGDAPNMNQGQDQAAKPYSMSKGEPDFVFRDLIAPKEAQANEYVDIEVSLFNSGDLGTKNIQLYLIDRNAHYKRGHLIGERKLVLDHNESQRIKFTVPLYSYGLNILKIDSLSTEVQVHRLNPDIVVQ